MLCASDQQFVGFGGNWIEIAYGTSAGTVCIIVQHPETLGQGPQLFQTFSVHCSPVIRVMISEKHLVAGISFERSFNFYQGSHASWKVLDFFLENSSTWKVLENQFGPGKSWKLKLKVLESPGKISLKVMHFSSGSNGKQAAIV